MFKVNGHMNALYVGTSVTEKIYKSCPKMISLEKLKILTPLQNCLSMWEIWAN